MSIFKPLAPSRSGGPAVALAVAVHLLAFGGDADAAPLVPLSPGAVETVAPTASPCPTFSWTFDPAASAIELAVFRLDVSGDGSAPEDAAPVLEERLPAGAVSWTPPADRCLDQGGSYAWFVRAGRPGRGGAVGWSEGNLFQVISAWPPGGDDRVPPGDEDPPADEDPPTSGRNGEIASEGSLNGPLPALIPAGVSGVAGMTPRRTRPPGESLDTVFRAAGHVEIAGDFRFSTPTGARSIVPAAAFSLVGNQEGYTWETGFGFGHLVEGPNFTVVRLTAPLLDLPHGAEITKLQCLAYDAVELDEAPGEPDIEDLLLDMKLIRRSRHETTNEVMASVFMLTDGTSPDIRSASDLTIDAPIVDREGYSYWIEGEYRPESQGSSLRFYGCELRFAIDRMDPL